MQDKCEVDCNLKEMMAEIHPKVNEIHEIVIGMKTAFKLIRGTAWVLGVFAAGIGIMWGAFIAIRG